MSLELRTRVMTVMLGLVSGCASASNGEGVADPNSQQLIAISRRATTPNASLKISYNGTYRFLDEEARKETAGQLTAGELSQLEEHASEAAIQGLVAHQVPDERCRDASTYMINSKFGNPCVVPAEISDADVRAHADFLVGLFSTKAARQQRWHRGSESQRFLEALALARGLRGAGHANAFVVGSGGVALWRSGVLG